MCVCVCVCECVYVYGLEGRGILLDMIILLSGNHLSMNILDKCSV